RLHGARDQRADRTGRALEDLGGLHVGEVFVEAQHDRGAWTLRESQEDRLHRFIEGLVRIAELLWESRFSLEVAPLDAPVPEVARRDRQPHACCHGYPR